MFSEEEISLERIQRLEELTETLTGSPRDPMPSCVEYNVTDGIAFGFACLNDRNISVQKAILSGGSKFPRHSHEGSNEWLIMYEGKIEAHINGTTTTLSPGDGIMFPAGEPHSINILEDTRLLGVTVPPSKGYPDVE